MHFVMAMMKHETNTFSPVPTAYASFASQAAKTGQDAYHAFKGTNTPLAAFIDLAEKEKASVSIPIAAEAWPSGTVHAEAYQRITNAICEAVVKGCDALFLDLHGAMVTQSTDDGEGTLLERIRLIVPHLPIAVALDLHANLTAKMVANCTAIAGYTTYPHVDMYTAGERVGRIVIDTLKGRVNPTMAWANCPMLPHTLKMGTDEAPMGDLVAAAKTIEAREALAVTLFGGFPLADIHDAGMSVAAVTDGDPKTAADICRYLTDMAWQRRHEFVYELEPLADSVARAAKLAEGPILLIDHADNCASGGTQDTMAVVAEVMRQGLEDVAVGAIRDPEAVQKMITAGAGSTVTLALGGKMDMPSIGKKGEPLEISGRIRVISDGEFVARGPMYTGVTMHMGKTAVLDAGSIQFVVIENNHEPFDLGMFRSVGIELTAKKYLLLKSRIHYRAGFQPIARHIIECNGVGVTSSDYNQFNFKKVRRPIFPLDPAMKRSV
ncbi:MAG: M81 family metallopeptidase [Deltaproteobacteria bacterium]|nr:M81 family metallopeptidase [Deltaproteobacteria bacterium]